MRQFTKSPKNRRLYDRQESRLCTRQAILDAVRAGETIEVTVLHDGPDITREILLDLLKMSEHRGSPSENFIGWCAPP